MVKKMENKNIKKNEVSKLQKKVIKKPIINSKIKPKKKSSTKKLPSKNKFPSKRWHAVPLKSSFMVIAMIGFLISAYWVYPQSFNFGVSFMVVFAAMFAAALISMTKAPIMPKDY